MVWKRARNPEQKEQRRLALLDAAARLFEQQPFDEISLNAIARAANISKANIYRYFESREELFLHLMLEDSCEWIDSLVPELDQLKGSEDDEAVVRILVSSLAARRRFVTLLSVLSSVLERNITVDNVVRFKMALSEQVQRIIVATGAALPSVSDDDIMQFLSTMIHLTGSVWQSAHPTPAVIEALEHPNLKFARVDFEQQMRQCLIIFLRGLRAKDPKQA
jgi:AcrR family transcriptional regulator